MILKNKYVIGCHVMWYEVEMFPEYIDSCIQMMKGIENPENVSFHFCFNYQEHLEKCSINLSDIWNRLEAEVVRIDNQFNIVSNISRKGTVKHFHAPEFYNIAAYRRDLNYNYCDKVDFVLWGETDSLWPKQTLEIIESVQEMVFESQGISKFVLNFADRVMWDKSWQVLVHTLFEKIQFQDNDEWVLNNEASGKSYMTLERMNEINNIPLSDVEIQYFNQPKFDGSCLVISSDLIKSGVNIPHALIHCGEDTSFAEMAKLIMGDQFVQFHVHNILHVHNRRHPKKRMYIKGENNPQGFCDMRKGEWWNILEKNSKKNLENLRNQFKFIKEDDVMKQIQTSKGNKDESESSY